MFKAKKLFIHSLPLGAGILLSYLFWRQNLVLFFLYVFIVSGVILTGRDKKVEFLVLIYGLVAGLAVESIGTSISGYQSFASPDFWGIPYWLIVSWGYGFVLMKRIGLIIANGSPWIDGVKSSS